MALKYTMERTESFGEIQITAKPNEWATHARATVIIKDDWHPEDKTPRIERINWSTGAREWTLEDARTFFRAALEMLDVAESELKIAEAQAEREGR